MKRGILVLAQTRADLEQPDREWVDRVLGGKVGGEVQFDIASAPLSFLRVLLDDSRLTAHQRAQVSMRVHGMNTRNESERDRVFESEVSSPVEFGSVFALLSETGPNCEVFLNNRWYPVTMGVEFTKSPENHVTKGVSLVCNIAVADATEHLCYPIGASLFIDSTGAASTRTVRSVLQKFGLRMLQIRPADHNLRLLQSERISGDPGSVVLVRGPVLVRAHFAWLSRLESRAMGTPALPRRCVVESELEVDENERYRYTPYAHDDATTSRLPFVRLFSLETKDYVYADVDDVSPCEFDDAALDRLHLPSEMLSILTRVFDAPQDQLFGDLIEGKHGGMVILAWGNPGVGKTLTAEVYAEHTRRPLYVLELGELGTNVAQVEENLRRVFTRVARWNAVLQFDECEIFLAERDDDLERSAIVGIFLRLLDYYEGILFLTTNRPGVLDHAVLSRVMLRLHYPDLDAEGREAVWRHMFAAAGITLDVDRYRELAETDINGREIRNVTRLAKILADGTLLTLDHVRGAIETSSGDALTARHAVNKAPSESTD